MNRQGRQISTGTTKRKAHDDGRWRRAPGLHAHGGRLEGDLEVLAAQRVAVHVGDGVHRVGHAVELHEAVPLALPRSLIADHLSCVRTPPTSAVVVVRSCGVMLQGQRTLTLSTSPKGENRWARRVSSMSEGRWNTNKLPPSTWYVFCCACRACAYQPNCHVKPISTGGMDEPEGSRRRHEGRARGAVCASACAGRVGAEARRGRPCRARGRERSPCAFPCPPLA